MRTIELRTKENFGSWTESVWPGNPELNLQARVKTFSTRFGKIPVWVYGSYPDYSFTVAAGANSDFSYTGGFYPDKCSSIEDACNRVDKLHEQKQLIK